MKTIVLVIGMLVVAISVATAANSNPVITNVSFSGDQGDYTLTVSGSGFGNLPRRLPFTGDTPYFRIADAAQLGFGEWGYSGDAQILTYRSWSDAQIQVSGFGGQPGDAVAIALWSPRSKMGATWGGNVPGGPAGTPQIASVTFSGTGENLRIDVRGSGFGDAPVAMPFTGDLNQFSLGDFRSHCGGGSSQFEAGAARWGHGSPNSLTLNYQLWSDTEIVIDGFSGSYGQGCDTIQTNDPVVIVLWNTGDTGQTGPQTAWGGPLVQSIPTLPDGTGGQIRILSGTGSFAFVSQANDRLNVLPGATLNGTVNLQVLNLGPDGAIAPLIYTPTWGDDGTSWQTINDWVPTGESTQQSQIVLTVPTRPGVYHIIFAVGWETTPDHVASATSWAIGYNLGDGWYNNYDIWNDGNDIAEFTVAQLASAQAYGWAFNNWLNAGSPTPSADYYSPRPIPADAITLVVEKRHAPILPR